MQTAKQRQERKQRRRAQKRAERKHARHQRLARREQRRKAAVTRFGEGDTRALETLGTIVTKPQHVAVLKMLDELGGRTTVAAIVDRIPASDVRPLFPYSRYWPHHIHRAFNQLQRQGVVITSGTGRTRVVQRCAGVSHSAELAGIIEQLTPRA